MVINNHEHKIIDGPVISHDLTHWILQQTCREGHLVQLVSLARVLKFEIPLKRFSDRGRDWVRGLLHLGQDGSASGSPRNTTVLKRWSQSPHLYSMVGIF